MGNFFKRLNQRGVIHLIPLFLILAGIIAGVYLVQKEGFQLFKPKASAENVTWILKSEDPDNSCVEVRGDRKITTCPTVEFNLVSSLETQTSSDAGFQLVKTVYARVAGFCSDDRKAIYLGYRKPTQPVPERTRTCPDNTQCTEQLIYKVNYADCVTTETKPAEAHLISEGWSCNNEGKIHKPGFLGFIGDTNIECSNNTECKLTEDKKGVACVVKEAAPATDTGDQPKGSTAEKPVNLSPKGNVNVSEGGQVNFYWRGPTSAKRYRLLISDLGKPNEKNTNRGCPKEYSEYFYCTERHVDNEYITAEGGGTAILGSKFQNGIEYEWWVDALDENGKIIGTGSVFRIKISKTAKSGPVAAPGGLEPVNCQDNPPGERPAGYSWKAVDNCQRSCSDTKNHTDCPQNTTSGYVRRETSNWCYGFKEGNRCLMLEYDGETGSTFKCTKGDAGSVTPTQASCVLGLRDDVLTQYGKDGWCTDDSNKQAIVNNWINRAGTSQADKDQVKNCLTAGTPGAGGTKVTGWIGSDNACSSDGIFTGCTLTGGKACSDYGAQNYQGWSQALYDKCKTICISSDRDSAAACPKKPDTVTKRTTRAYRLAENTSDLVHTAWKPYSVGGTKVKYTFLNPRGGVKTIYIQFQDGQGETINPTPLTATIELVPASSGTDNNKLTADCTIAGSTSVKLNQEVTYRATVNGGLEGKNYIYTWDVDVRDRVVTVEKSASVTKSFTTSGVKQVTLSVGSPGSEDVTVSCPDVTVTGSAGSGSSGGIPAGSDCSAYETTAVCGEGIKTYDKCTDNKGQTGSQLCSGSATRFYCEGSTNSNCISDPTRKGNYSCSACPNLRGRYSRGDSDSCTPRQTTCSCSSSDPTSQRYPGKCYPDCNGGWCKGGICAICGAQ